MSSKSKDGTGSVGTASGTKTMPNAKKVVPEQNNQQQQFADDFSDRTSQSHAQQGVEDTVWKVGCYKINPSTPSGQKFFILHMLVLPLIPITALVIQNSVTMNTLLGYQSRVKTIRNQVLLGLRNS